MLFLRRRQSIGLDVYAPTGPQQRRGYRHGLDIVWAEPVIAIVLSRLRPRIADDGLKLFVADGWRLLFHRLVVVADGEVWELGQDIGRAVFLQRVLEDEVAYLGGDAMEQG